MNSPNISYNTGGWLWAADNGCFSDKWDESLWKSWLSRTRGSLFAVVPDVVGDAAATQERWGSHLATVKDSKHSAAFVLQDGQTADSVPWSECDAVFIGGSTEFKLSPEAEALTREAVSRGKWAHMGRVNSLKRMKTAASWGCGSVDGTYLAFGPAINTPKLLNWLKEVSLS